MNTLKNFLVVLQLGLLDPLVVSWVSLDGLQDKVSRPAERHWATRTEAQYISSGSTRTILGEKKI